MLLKLLYKIILILESFMNIPNSHKKLFNVFLTPKYSLRQLKTAKNY